MDEHEFSLVQELMNQNEEMRVIVVGDDDQNIYTFRGAKSEYMERFITERGAVKYELTENYRSVPAVVDLSNEFVARLKHRMKETPISAIRNETGIIRLIRYSHGNLVEPVVADLKSASLSGTTCVLCKTNDEASQVTGLLLRNGIAAKLIQSNDGFNLWNLIETRYFIDQLNNDAYLISDDAWNEATRNLKKQYSRSNKLDICLTMLSDFNLSNPKKRYRSDLEVFIKESKMEDFFKGDGETIFVSTIHKTKGKEFDNVFLMLDNFICKGDVENRQLYVGITRTKTNLFIHTNGDHFDNIRVNGFQRVDNTNKYAPPDYLTFHLTLKDVWLDYFIKQQSYMTGIFAGDRLQTTSDGCATPQGNLILRFSKLFKEQIEKMASKGYKLSEGRVNYVLYWQKENEAGEMKEYLIMLPEVSFVKSHNL
jgi:ATP-dependent DNA helicase RecQ